MITDLSNGRHNEMVLYFMVHIMDLVMAALLLFLFHLVQKKKLAGQFIHDITVMDYLVIGSNGFAQVGSPDFFKKNKVEMKVLMEFLTINYPKPEEFCHMCYYKVKWFLHDFGSYSEIVLIYDDYILTKYDENDPEKYNRFCNWFNEVEVADLEMESYNQPIKLAYEKNIQLQPVRKSDFQRI